MNTAALGTKSCPLGWSALFRAVVLNHGRICLPGNTWHYLDTLSCRNQGR